MRQKQTEYRSDVDHTTILFFSLVIFGIQIRFKSIVNLQCSMNDRVLVPGLPRIELVLHCHKWSSSSMGWINNVKFQIMKEYHYKYSWCTSLMHFVCLFMYNLLSSLCSNGNHIRTWDQNSI